MAAGLGDQRTGVGDDDCSHCSNVSRSALVSAAVSRMADGGNAKPSEMGDASVPFPFDVHALISTSDAPTLESSLHKHFGERRVNLENERKEFFNVTIEELKLELEQLTDRLGIESELQLTLVAEAKQYRISEARRQQLEGGSI